MTVSLLQLGLGGMAAAQGALANTANNIANANTPDYARRDVVLATAAGAAGGASLFGNGVQVEGVRRSYDQFLAGALQGLSSQSAADRTRAQALDQLDAVFADADLGLGAAMDQAFGALGDVANRPADAAARQLALARIDQLARRFNTVGQQLATLEAQGQARLQADAAQVNARLSELRQLNAQIPALSAAGQAPNDLLDQRDRALLALGELLPVHTVTNADGTLHIYTPAGAPLLVEQTASTLEAAPLPGDPRQLGLRLQTGSASQWLTTDALVGGSLGGTLAFLGQDLAPIASLLDALARGLADGLNAAHAQGVDATGQPGQALLAHDAGTLRPPGAAISLRALSLAPAQLATGVAALAQPALGNTGSARVARLDIAQAPLDVSQPVALVFADPPTQYSLTGLPGGDLLNQPYTPGQALPPPPATGAGWRLLLTGTPAAGDRFDITRNPAPGADNRNALALQALARQPLADGATPAQGYAALVGEVGGRVQSGRDQAGVSERLAGEARQRKAQVSGVNLDEEAAALLRHQQAYQACARVLQTSQSLFDALLSATGR